MNVLVIVRVCRARLMVMLLRNLDVILSPMCCVNQVAGVKDCQVRGAKCWRDAVASVLAVRITGILIDDVHHHVRIPVKAPFVFGLEEFSLQRHGVSRLAVGPGEVASGWRNGGEFNAVVDAHDVKISLEVNHVVVHATRQGVVDLIAKFLVMCIVGGLDITGCANLNTNGSVYIKGVAGMIISWYQG